MSDMDKRTDEMSIERVSRLVVAPIRMFSVANHGILTLHFLRQAGSPALSHDAGRPMPCSSKPMLRFSESLEVNRMRLYLGMVTDANHGTWY